MKDASSKKASVSQREYQLPISSRKTLCDCGIGERSVFAGGFNGRYQVLLNAGFDDIAANAGLRRKLIEDFWVVLSHDQDFSITDLLMDESSGLKTIQTWHGYVQQNHVRF